MSTTGRTTRSATHRRGYLLAGSIAFVGLTGAGVWAGTALLAELTALPASSASAHRARPP